MDRFVALFERVTLVFYIFGHMDETEGKTRGKWSPIEKHAFNKALGSIFIFVKRMIRMSHHND